MHHIKVSDNYPDLAHNQDPSLPIPDEYKDMPLQPLGNKQKQYDDYVQGCVHHYGEKKGARCYMNERERIAMTLRQPKSMVNYTTLGYTKMKAPPKVFELIKEFWERNKHNQKDEQWPVGNTYVNHWQSPSKMVSVDDTELEGGGFVLKQHIWNAARDTISAWTGQQLAECSLYGIRVYKEGAMLAPHVDRLPLVASAIINVDQDVDEPWPLEVISHTGHAVNITMEPGDLVLYESHSVIHGRQFPLKGRFMANIFIHFEPIGPVGREIDVDSDLPQYIIRGSEEEEHWRRSNPKGYQLQRDNMRTSGSTDAHTAAMHNDVVELKRLLKEQWHLVESRDTNGWTPLIEAVRGGHIESIQILLAHGADVNARTRGKKGGASGGSVLWWAREYGAPPNVIDLLKANGAKNFPPESAEHTEL